MPFPMIPEITYAVVLWSMRFGYADRADMYKAGKECHVQPHHIDTVLNDYIARGLVTPNNVHGSHKLIDRKKHNASVRIACREFADYVYRKPPRTPAERLHDYLLMDYNAGNDHGVVNGNGCFNPSHWRYADKLIPYHTGLTGGEIIDAIVTLNRRGSIECDSDFKVCKLVFN